MMEMKVAKGLPQGGITTYFCFSTYCFIFWIKRVWLNSRFFLGKIAINY